MDFSIKYEDVDGAIRQFQSGIQRLQDVVSQLKTDISDFNGGGFTGQSADKFNDLIERKIGLVNQLIQAYEGAIGQLQTAKQNAQEADQELQRRVRAI
jgi:WXG100 family type VII secretion target